MIVLYFYIDDNDDMMIVMINNTVDDTKIRKIKSEVPIIPVGLHCSR